MSKKSLVTYFSASGVTKKLAENLAKAADADIYEIVPKEIYTEEDLDYKNEKSRSYVEIHTEGSRPEIKDNDLDTAQYDAVYVGFPIWWKQAPVIVNTFLEKEDFKGKKIVPFATSGGDEIGDAGLRLKESAKDSEVLEGKVHKADESEENLKEWIKTLNI